MDNYIDVPTIPVHQPLGTFYIASIPARKLLNICYSDPAEVSSNGMDIEGTQRAEDKKRLKEISEFIQTQSAAFPNSIIIGANYDESGNYVSREEEAWRVENDRLIVPFPIKLASIIDGQHRWNAFSMCPDEYKDIELLCAIYLELPVPYHAYLFSTINFNQKKVPKSLAYNLFGFELENNTPDKWVPDTLAVSLVRKLNSQFPPLKNRIELGVVGGGVEPGGFKVSMATMVDGVLRLFSQNPKSDRHRMMKEKLNTRSRKILKEDKSPLRDLYIGGHDDVIYEILCNFFGAVNDTLWTNLEERSYINQTIGFQALFDVLRFLVANFMSDLNADIGHFMAVLEKVRVEGNGRVSFIDGISPSGGGRTEIRKRILNAINEDQ